MPGKHKVLVIGSSGMLGIDLCKELAGDYDLAGFDTRSSVFSRQSSVKFKKRDITNRDEVLKSVARFRPEIVVHAAAYTDVDGCELDPKRAYLVNSLGTENVALACRSVDAALVYISTDFVFDGRKNSPYTERDKTGPLSVYGDSKLEGELSVKKILKKYLILRTCWLYGRHGKNFVDTILGKTKSGKALKVVDDQIGSPTYTKDLAKAIYALLDKVFTSYQLPVTSYGIYHVSNSGAVSWYNYARTILKYAGSKAKVLPISSEELNRPAERPAMSVLNNAKFEKFAGFKMRSWKAALKEYLK